MAVSVDALKCQGGERYLAELSDGRQFLVPATVVADLSLYTGKDLSDEEIKELEGAAGFFKCRERALRMIGARPMSCKELSDRLVQKGESRENAELCVEWLLERHYLDDEKYAAMVVRHYSAKGYGVHRIKSELYRRGIDKNLWDEALEELPESDDTVYRLLCKKLKTDEPDRAEMKRATDSLYRRGFSWDEIKSAVNRFREESGFDS